VRAALVLAVGPWSRLPLQGIGSRPPAAQPHN